MLKFNTKLLLISFIGIAIVIGVIYGIRSMNGEISLSSQQILGNSLDPELLLKKMPFSLPALITQEQFPLPDKADGIRPKKGKDKGQPPVIWHSYPYAGYCARFGEPIYIGFYAYDPECQDISLTIDGKDVSGTGKSFCSSSISISGIAKTVGKQTFQFIAKDQKGNKAQGETWIRVLRPDEQGCGGYGY